MEGKQVLSDFSVEGVKADRSGQRESATTSQRSVQQSRCLSQCIKESVEVADGKTGRRGITESCGVSWTIKEAQSGGILKNGHRSTSGPVSGANRLEDRLLKGPDTEAVAQPRVYTHVYGAFSSFFFFLTFRNGN